MAKGKVYTSSYPDNPPDWYWVNGLHDACIVDVEYFEFPFDYNKFVGNKNSYDRNLMLLKINASGALYEQDIKEIKLFNFNIITNNIELQGRKKVWWLADRLTEKDGHYYLEIDLQDFDSFPEDFTFKIKFDRAEVIR
ncbi:MAG: hypothetical protein IJD45_04355 [Clostridia bacterium]|nr:hypothetical protein [Clostridia bacterium]